MGSANSNAAPTGHRRRVGAASLCAASLGAVVALLVSSADALFLTRVGARHLGTAFAISAGTSVALFWGLGALADRRSRPALLYRTSWISLASVLALLLCLDVVPKVASAVLLVAGKQVGGALELLLWLVIADRFTAREARKLLPWLVVANGAGATVGALCVGPLASFAGVVAPLWAAAALLVVVGACARLLMRAPDLRIAQTERRKPRVSMWSGVDVLRSRPLAAWLAGLVASAGLFAPIMYYLLSITAAIEYPSEVELAGFLGRYRAYVQGAALIAQVMLAPWLSRRLGVGLMLLLAPVGAVAVGVFVGATDTLVVVALAQAATRILDVAIQTPTEQLIQNLLPEELRGRVAGFIGGVAKRSGTIVGGLLASALVVWPAAFHGALLAAALSWFAIAFALWRRFAGLAVAELSGTASRIGAGPGGLAAGLADARGLARLQERLVSADSREQESAISLLHRLGSAGTTDVIAELLRALAATRDARAAERLGSAIRFALGEGIPVDAAAASMAVRAKNENSSQAAIAWTVLGCLGNASDSDIEEAEAVLEDSGELSLEVTVARMRGESVLDVLAVAGHTSVVVHELRCEIARAARGSSADSLEDLGERLLRTVARCEEPALQLAGLESVVQAMGSPERSALGVLVSSRLEQLAETWRTQPEAKLREASLVAMCASAAPDYRSLVNALGDADDGVRMRAQSLVRNAGNEALEALSIASQSGRARVRMGAVAILADMRPSEEALRALLKRELAEMVRASEHAKVMSSLSHGTLVCRRLQERVEEAAQAALLALEALGTSTGLGVVARRLARAVSMRSRARALEALDALLPRRIAGDMLGALEGTLESTVSAREAIESELTGSDRLTRDLLVHALGNEGGSEYRGLIAEAAEVARAEADPLALVQKLLGDETCAGDTVVADVPNLMETIAVLSELSLFADLQAVQLEELASVVQWRYVKSGETLMEQGEQASCMFFVQLGQLDVVVRGETVATLGPGEPVGELGLFSEDRRSATVVAASDGLLGMVTREDIENLIEEVPGIALRLCRAMSRRLAEANER